MILFFRTPSKSVIAVESNHQLTPDESNKLCWLFGEAVTESEENLKGCFVGPRREMITPWSTNEGEITQNMGLEDILRTLSPQNLRWNFHHRRRRTGIVPVPDDQKDHTGEPE